MKPDKPQIVPLNSFRMPSTAPLRRRVRHETSATTSPVVCQAFRPSRPTFNAYGARNNSTPKRQRIRPQKIEPARQTATPVQRLRLPVFPPVRQGLRTPRPSKPRLPNRSSRLITMPPLEKAWAKLSFVFIIVILFKLDFDGWVSSYFTHLSGEGKWWTLQERSLIPPIFWFSFENDRLSKRFDSHIYIIYVIIFVTQQLDVMTKF